MVDEALGVLSANRKVPPKPALNNQLLAWRLRLALVTEGHLRHSSEMPALLSEQAPRRCRAGWVGSSFLFGFRNNLRGMVAGRLGPSKIRLVSFPHLC